MPLPVPASTTYAAKANLFSRKMPDFAALTVHIIYELDTVAGGAPAPDLPRRMVRVHKTALPRSSFAAKYLLACVFAHIYALPQSARSSPTLRTPPPYPILSSSTLSPLFPCDVSWRNQENRGQIISCANYYGSFMYELRHIQPKNISRLGELFVPRCV